MRTESSMHTVNVWQFPGVMLEHYCYAPGPAGALVTHAHNEYQLGLSLNFPGEYTYRGSTYAVPVGSLSILHPGELHAARDVELRQVSAEFRMLYLSPELMQHTVRDIAGRSESLPFFTTPVLLDARIVTLFLSVHRALTAPTTSQLEHESLLLSLLQRLIRHYAHQPMSGRSLTTARPEVLRARDYIHAHAVQSISLQDLAQIAGLSPFHFARAFRQEIGLPPHRYQMQIRIDHARRLLAQGVSIANVATDIGFYDQSHFGWHFKRLVGVTPARYVGMSKNFLDTL
jgi:AraC-like DNA-binding protein